MVIVTVQDDRSEKMFIKEENNDMSGNGNATVRINRHLSVTKTIGKESQQVENLETFFA